MKIVSKRLKWILAIAIACGASFVVKGAYACTNDIDCTDTAACGGQVCDWNKGMTCQPAGGAAQGQDGWCTHDSDCKCHGMGAVCNAPYCSFTKPSTSATGGASGSTGGTSGGGSSGSTGGSGSGGTSGSDAGTTTSKDSGGCAIAGSTSSSGLAALAALGILIGLGRRRHRRNRA